MANSLLVHAVTPLVIITTFLKDNLIMETTTDFSEVEITADSVIEPLGDCRFRINGRTFEFAIRKLTPKECFRLMDVPDNEFNKLIVPNEKGQQSVSNSQLYKMAGNSIVVACLYHQFESVFYPTTADSQPPTPIQLSLF